MRVAHEHIAPCLAFGCAVQTTSCVFDETLYFNFKDLTREEVSQTVFHTRTVTVLEPFIDPS